MAPLIPDARAAREEAERLRVQALELKFALRESTVCSREQLRAAEAALDRVRAHRFEPLPSPWSPLLWTYDDGVLDSVLVSLR